MVKRWPDNGMLRWALLISILLHSCIALVWPNLISRADDPAAPIESISFAHLSQIKFTTPAPKFKSVPRVPAMTQRVAPVRARVRPGARHRSPNAAAAKTVARVNTPVVSEPVQQLAAAPSPTVQTSAAATPAPSAPPREVAQSDGSDTGGVMPFGATLDTPVLDPRIKSELQNRFKLGVVVTIVVGDDGKTKSISFHPPQDQAVEAQIRSLLASANWDPAVCGGGIACEKSAELKL